MVVFQALISQLASEELHCGDAALQEEYGICEDQNCQLEKT